MVLPDSRRISRVLRYSGVSSPRCFAFAYGAVTLFGRPFITVQLTQHFVTRRKRCNPSHEIPRPPPSNACMLALGGFRLVPVRSPLLGESLFAFYSSRYLDVSVPWLGCRWLCIHHGLAGNPCAGFPIRISPDQNLLAVPRSFSQLSTSFIASDRLGIHRAPFVA